MAQQPAASSDPVVLANEQIAALAQISDMLARLINTVESLKLMYAASTGTDVIDTDAVGNTAE